jgi:replication factor A1
MERRMKAKDLRPESKVDVIDLTVTSKGDVREFTSRSGSVGKVCDCKAKDEDVQITLWNEEIDRVSANDRVRISNGWVREWRGNMQVSAGRYGRLEVLK